MRVVDEASSVQSSKCATRVVACTAREPQLPSADLHIYVSSHPSVAFLASPLYH